MTLALKCSHVFNLLDATRERFQRDRARGSDGAECVRWLVGVAKAYVDQQGEELSCGESGWLIRFQSEESKSKRRREPWGTQRSRGRK
jgi:hypothetical protein